METPPQDPEPYDILHDPAVIDAAKGDPDLDILLDGLAKAREVLQKQPTSTHRYVAEQAEINVWDRVSRRGYGTTEFAPPEDSDRS